MRKKEQENEITKSDKEEIKKDVINEIKSALNTEFKEKYKEEIIKEIRYEANTVVKDDIKEQLIIDVNNEIKDNIRKEQKRLLRHKSFKIFKKNIIILILLAVTIYFAYCLWDVKYFKFMRYPNSTKEVVNVTKDETKEEEIIKDKAWYIENYGYLLDNTKINLPMYNYNIYALYDGNYNISNIKDAIKLNLAYKLVENIVENDYSYVISEDEMKKAYYKLFGTYDYYNSVSFNVDCMQFYYNGYDKNFIAYKFSCDSSNSFHIKEEIKDMYEENGNIIIETVMGVYSDNNYLFNYTNLYNAVSLDFNDEKSLLDYENSLNSYKYTFKNIDNSYYFDSVEKLK